MPSFLIGCLDRWPTPSEPAFDRHAGGPPSPCFLIGCLDRWPTPSEPTFDRHASRPPSPCFLIGCLDRWPTPSEPAFDRHASGPPSPCFLIGCLVVSYSIFGLWIPNEDETAVRVGNLPGVGHDLVWTARNTRLAKKSSTTEQWCDISLGTKKCENLNCRWKKWEYSFIKLLSTIHRSLHK
jgi:hypothetical protein